MRIPATDGSNERVLGIRSNDSDVLKAVRQRLGSAVLDDEDPPANISIKVGAESRLKRDAHYVYRGATQVLRAVDRDDVIDGALSLLHTFVPAPAPLSRLNARAIVRGGEAVLVTDAYNGTLGVSARRLRSARWDLVPHSPVTIDPYTGELVLPLAPERFEPLTTKNSRRVPVSTLVAFAPPPDDHRAASPAFPFAQLLTLVAGRKVPTRGKDITALFNFTEKVRVVRLATLENKPIVAALLAL